ncbi:MAG: hypothetical protein KBH18_05290, partial [Eubacterium sp.]|nr:hypothetical protein [Eubacterium sp.]
MTKGFAESQICSCQNKIKNTFIEKWLELSVQATFGTFRLLLGGSTNVQHPLAKYEIYLTFSKSPHFLCEFFTHHQNKNSLNTTFKPLSFSYHYA